LVTVAWRTIALFAAAVSKPRAPNA